MLEEADDWQEADIFLSVPGDGNQSEEDSADEESTIPSINKVWKSVIIRGFCYCACWC